MNINKIICAIEIALRDEGCNEVTIDMLFERTRKPRGMGKISMNDLIEVITILASEGLYEIITDKVESVTEDTLISRSQNHPSVPGGGVSQL